MDMVNIQAFCYDKENMGLLVLAFCTSNFFCIPDVLCYSKSGLFCPQQHKIFLKFNLVFQVIQVTFIESQEYFLESMK